MGYSSAAVPPGRACSPASGPGALRDLILRAARGALTRLAAGDVRDRLKSVKSKVNVQVAPAQRTLDMTALARPERDLWWVISGDQNAARYSWRTGWTVGQDALALNRLRWGQEDIAEFLSGIRGPHQRTADTLVSWTGLQHTLQAIAEGLETP